MRVEAKFSLKYENEREADAVAKAVSPDNVEIPPGLIVETHREKCRLVASVCCSRSLETFTATLDDLLACISAAEKTFKAIKALSKKRVSTQLK